MAFLQDLQPIPKISISQQLLHWYGRKGKEKAYPVRRDKEASDRPWRPIAALT